MRAPWSELYVHVVWSTWKRQPLIGQEVEQLLVRCIHAECANMKAHVVALGVMPDHVHLLVRIPTALSIAALVKQVKGSSSHLINSTCEGRFQWQGGYGAFTVSKEVVPRVRGYILNQRSHHGENTCYPDWERTGIDE